MKCPYLQAIVIVGNFSDEPRGWVFDLAVLRCRVVNDNALGRFVLDLTRQVRSLRRCSRIAPALCLIADVCCWVCTFSVEFLLKSPVISLDILLTGQRFCRKCGL